MVIETFKCSGTAQVVNLERWLALVEFLTVDSRGPATVVFLWWVGGPGFYLLPDLNGVAWDNPKFGGEI
jgi:hypothetical protein